MEASYKTINYYNALGEKVLENLGLEVCGGEEDILLFGKRYFFNYFPVFHYDFYSKVKSAGINDDRVVPYAIFGNSDFVGKISNNPLSINPNIKYRVETLCCLLEICENIYQFFEIAEDIIGGDCEKTDNLIVFTIDGFTAFLLMVFSCMGYVETGITGGKFGLYDVNDDDLSNPLFEIHEEKKYKLAFVVEQEDYDE